MATTTRKMTDNPVVQRIVGLVEERGYRDKELTDYLVLMKNVLVK